LVTQAIAEEDLMSSPRPVHLALTLGALTLAACGEDIVPTQPETPGDPALLEALASNTWALKPALPGFAFRGGAAGVAPNPAGQSILYVFGGTDNEGGSGFPVQAYNVATNTWHTKVSEVSVSHTNGVGKVGNRLYVSGGYDLNGDFPAPIGEVWAYDYATDRMIAKRPMPLFTADGVTGVIDGKLYVLPGTCATENWPSRGYCEQPAIRKLFRYNPATNIWAQMAPSPHFHARGAGGVIDGKFYVAGGSNGAGGSSGPYLDVYDPATNSWKTLPPMPAAGSGPGAVIHGKLFVIVGTSTYSYNPVTNV